MTCQTHSCCVIGLFWLVKIFGAKLIDLQILLQNHYKSDSFLKFQCLLCDFTSTCPRKLEEHINRAHFDLTSPSVVANSNANTNTTNSTFGLDNPTLALGNATLTLTNAMASSPGPGTSTYQCPICEKEFSNGSEIEVHVNVEHKDILSPQKAVSTFISC